MIIFTHHTGEPHGILGAQTAATYAARVLSSPCIVVGLQRDFSTKGLLPFVNQYYGDKPKIIAFSHLCGRKDIIYLVALLREAGYRTILGGPQAAQDYRGEDGHEEYRHRFQGFKELFDVAFHGPVDYVTREHFTEATGSFEMPWKNDLFLDTDWSNLYVFRESLQRLNVQVAQVLHTIGCPWATKGCEVTIDPPSNLRDRVPALPVRANGCVFCDVARDKGFYGRIDEERVWSQIDRLPEKDGRKIPFELIDEYPIRPLTKLLDGVDERHLQLSQVNLVSRVDDINRHRAELADALKNARARGIKIMFSSIGFESFSDRILRNFNKGISVDAIVECVNTLRRLKEDFGDILLYRRDEGGNHGFIHPTPWDDAETAPEINRNIFLYRFFDDILPEHSTPLIVHHSSFLADWIREIESKTGLAFNRDGTWIEWWKEPTQ